MEKIFLPSKCCFGVSFLLPLNTNPSSGVFNNAFKKKSSIDNQTSSNQMYSFGTTMTTRDVAITHCYIPNTYIPIYIHTQKNTHNNTYIQFNMTEMGQEEGSIINAGWVCFIWITFSFSSASLNKSGLIHHTLYVTVSFLLVSEGVKNNFPIMLGAKCTF